MKQLCEKKEKELKDALESYNEKSKIKTDLVGRLMDIVTEIERQRMQNWKNLTDCSRRWAEARALGDNYSYK